MQVCFKTSRECLTVCMFVCGHSNTVVPPSQKIDKNGKRKLENNTTSSLFEQIGVSIFLLNELFHIIKKIRLDFS